MAEPLRPMLLGIVLLNLVFVQVTDALATEWLLVLYGLTLCSPFLVRMHGSMAYRSAWNLAVLGVFAILVHDATTGGTLRMLEDGLLLASLCQVHLLNNLGPKQKPDLLFFNSFLIAFVTSFFCQDIEFSVVFALYVAVLIPGLQLFCTVRADRPADKDMMRAVLRDSAPRTVVALMVTALVFALWPRDFRREGWVGEHLSMGNFANLAVGFSEKVELGRSGETTLSDREVMRITPRGDSTMPVPTHWRGATFLVYGTNGWDAVRSSRGRFLGHYDAPWHRTESNAWSRPSTSTGASLRVELSETLSQRMFLPLSASEVVLQPPATAEYAYPLMDGTLMYAKLGSLAVDKALVYDVVAGRGTAKSSPNRYHIQTLLQLDKSIVPNAVELADGLRAELGEDADALAIIEKFRSHLANTYHYLLPGTKGAARDMADFLSGDSGGHCEYFASALVFMLRSQDIPCRLVTGFVAVERDEETKQIVVRRRHAHAWVEVYLHDQGWLVVDPTPAAEIAAGSEARSWWRRMVDWLDELWVAVTRFDEKSRAEVLAWLQRAPGRLAETAARHPLSTGGIVGFLVLLLVVRRRNRHRSTPATVRHYLACLRRAGIRPEPGSTPRELLALARTQPTPETRIAALSAAVQAHEAERYRHG